MSSLAVAPPSLVPAGLRTVFYGDSYTSVSGGQEYDTASRVATGYSLWTEILHGGIEPLANEGVDGETIAQIRARLSDVTRWSPDLVVLMSAGVNSVKGAATYESIIADLGAIFDTLTGRGIVVATSTIPPSTLIDTAGEIEVLFRVNAWLIEQSRRRRNLIVIDGYALCADPTAGTIAWRAGYSTDGTHPNGIGSAALGAAFTAALRTALSPAPVSMPFSDLDPAELAGNAMATGAGGTGGLPTGWAQVGGVGTNTQIARSDIPGNWQEWVNTSGTNTILQDVAAGFAIGDTVRARFEIDVRATAGMTGAHFVTLEARNGGTPLLNSTVNIGDATGYPVAGPLYIRTNPLIIPATTTVMRPYHRLVTAGTVRLGRMSVQKLTP